MVYIEQLNYKNKHRRKESVCFCWEGVPTRKAAELRWTTSGESEQKSIRIGGAELDNERRNRSKEP